ncbi:MAG TPA: dienelactone hydrolase family protein [Gemmatimonadetes bacterium]|jgi:carboxymethylenebutenolidase|nr:dienelactone hydrolase family protein [Gemmatimonadota bacterium]
MKEMLRNPFRVSAVFVFLIMGIGTTTLTSQTIPADEEGSVARLDGSPRHGEWLTYDAGDGDMVRAWVTYPERSGPAPVVVVIHEIYGLTDWIRGVADQLSRDGFIAVAPDLLDGHGPNGGGSDSMDRQEVVATIRTLDRVDVNRRLKAAADFGTGLPSATDRVGVVGYCWGGSSSFLFAVDNTGLDAAVVYYGSSPEMGFESISAPILGLYGGNDERVNSTINRAEVAMSRLNKMFIPNIFEGAGHGFLRNQTGQDGANMHATEEAWPLTIDFFRRHLES